MRFGRDENIKAASRYLREMKIWSNILKKRDVQKVKQKLSVQEVKSETFKLIWEDALWLWYKMWLRCLSVD